MSDTDPWAQPADPTVHVIASHRATMPPPGVPLTPPRSRWPLALGLVLGVVALVMVLVIGLAVAIPLFLGQREKGERAAADRSEDSQIVDDVVDGDGYRYQLPIGWEDVTDRARAQAEGEVTDTATAWAPPDGGAPSSIIVEEDRVSRMTLDEFAPAWQRNAQGAIPGGVQLVQGDDTTIAGARALTMTALDVPAEFGAQMDLVSFLVSQDDHFFAVTFTYPAEGDADGQLLVERTLAGWEWE